MFRKISKICLKQKLIIAEKSKVYLYQNVFFLCEFYLYCWQVLIYAEFCYRFPEKNTFNFTSK